MPARSRTSRPPSGLRNGLVWRDGRPRWSPSPTQRRLGAKGFDLKAADGSWMERGAAIAASDARKLWADLIREAAAGGAAGEGAIDDLRKVLATLPTPLDADARWKRRQVQDLIDLARAQADGFEKAAPVGRASRTVNAMIDGYFDAAKAPETAAWRPPATETVKSYSTAAKRIRAKFGLRACDSVSRGEVRTWYVELAEEVSLPTANLTMGAFGAFYRWALWADWLGTSPISRLGVVQAAGRRVFWTPEEEQAFVPWCDANRFEDVGDAVVLGLWTGASQIDMCAVELAALKGDTWRYVRHKTRRKGQEALAGLLPMVKARVQRRMASTVTAFSSRFLIRPDGSAHDTDTIYDRFRQAQALALAQEAVPASFATKRLQDMRDTCVTRLAAAEVPFMRIWPWTAHSPKSAETILRDHYISLLEDGAMKTARQLQDWAEASGVILREGTSGER